MAKGRWRISYHLSMWRFSMMKYMSESTQSPYLILVAELMCKKTVRDKAAISEAYVSLARLGKD